MMRRYAKAAGDVLVGKSPSLKLRSRLWPKARLEHLARQPTCQVCGVSWSLEVHHILPFHQYPDLELCPSNMITLCQSKAGGVNCHLAVGHLGDYRRFNPHVVEDSEAMLSFFAKLRLGKTRK